MANLNDLEQLVDKLGQHVESRIPSGTGFALILCTQRGAAYSTNLGPNTKDYLVELGELVGQKEEGS